MSPDPDDDLSYAEYFGFPATEKWAVSWKGDGHPNSMVRVDHFAVECQFDDVVKAKPHAVIGVAIAHELGHQMGLDLGESGVHDARAHIMSLRPSPGDPRYGQIFTNIKWFDEHGIQIRRDYAPRRQ